jgi:hypothetical protein
MEEKYIKFDMRFHKAFQSKKPNSLFELNQSLSSKFEQRIKQAMKAVFKIYKILTALYLLVLILGFIFPTRIRYNIITLFQTFSSEGTVGITTGAILLFLSALIFWFAPKTLSKLFSTKGQLKKFWDEI